jgi:glycosyltransferase involved in cell wall biosynthesis
VLFLCTRALEPVYQIETLLESFAECHKRNPRAALLLASDGSRRQWVDGFVQRHNLETVVAVTGTLDHDVVLDCFAQADCYVSCAACDGASISLLEAMAFGLPSIVTDLPGNREWIRPGTNGWLAPLNDVHEFANGMIEAAALKLESRNQIADVSKNIVSAKADWCANSETFIRFLSKCVADSSAKHKTRSPTLGGTCRR